MRMLKMTARLLLSGTTLFPAYAMAQSTQAPAASATASTSTLSNGIGDIVVTAQRREERLQSVPIAITAIDSASLAKNGITDITRLDTVTPGFTIGQTGSDVRPALRGVKTDNSRQGSADASVAFFIDGIYQSSNQQALSGFYDLARVEVQRGPQGTLYGRNSFGGNVSVVTNLPTDKFEGSMRGEYGNFGHYRIDGMLNIPLTDTLALRVAGVRDKSDGYVKNIDPAGGRAMDSDEYMGRATLRWKPNEKLDVILRGSTWVGGGHGGGAYEYKVGGILADPANPANQSLNGSVIPINPRANASDGLPELAAYPYGVPIPSGPWTNAADTPAHRRLRNYAGSAEVNYDLGFANWKTILSYNHFVEARSSDGDFSQYHLRYNLQTSSNNTKTAETQLASHPGSPFQWVAGFYYLDTDASEYFQQYFYQSSSYGSNVLTRFDTKSYAAYAQLSYNLTDALRVTGGVRYTDDRKSSDGIDYVADAIYPYEKASFHKVTWRGAVDYKIDRDKMLYASVSSGFRSGGFNTGVSAPAPTTFAPEKVTAYEIGAKTRWLDDTFQFNISAFYNRFTSLQVVSLDPTTLLVYTQNVGKENAKGVEVEAIIKPTRQFTVGITAAYLDAYYTQFIAIDPILYDRNVSEKGNQVAMSPKVRIGLSADYAIPLWNGGTLTPRVQTHFSSRYYLLDFNTAIEKQSAYTRTDLRLTYTAPNDRYTVEGYVTNVENSAIRSGGEFGGRGAFFIGYEPPREYGVSVAYKF